MLNQSFRQVFVTNQSALLPSGSTVDNIAVGQIGIVDAKTYVATAAPTYGTNKALYLVHGTADTKGLPFMFGPPNQNEYTKLIKGRLLRNFRGKAAHKGQTESWVVGYSGDPTDTNTLFARVGEKKGIDITLTGDPIDKIFSTQGVTRKFQTQIGTFDECVDGDPCALVECRLIAEDLVAQINSDPQISRYVKASVIVDCSPSLPAGTTDTDYKFKLVVPDTRDAFAKANVQAQYAGDKVSAVGSDGINSIYSVVRDTNTLPAAFSTGTTLIIPDCDVCPAGYTLIDTGFAYKVVKSDAGDAGALAAVAAQYGIDATESVSRASYQGGQSTYVIASDSALTAIANVNEVQSVVATGATSGTFTLTFDGQTTAAIAFNATAAAVQTALEALSNIQPGAVTVAGGPLPATAVTITFNNAQGNVPAITANSGSLVGGTAVVSTPTAGVSGGGDLQFLGAIRHSCVLNTPTTVAWVADGTLTKYAKAFRLTIADDVCSNDRLTAIQAAYPGFTVTLVAGSTAACLHTYEITVFSQAVDPANCSPDQLVFQQPQPFEGVEWIAVARAAIPGGTTCKCGVRLDAAFVNRVTNDCTFDSFPYEYQTVHIHVSSFNQNYNASPNEEYWVARKLQAALYPAGDGGRVQRLEKASLGYNLTERSFDPVVRELEQYQLQAQQGVFYDEYVLHYDFAYMVGGYAQTITDSYQIFVYFPAGQGKAFEAAVNGYIASAGLPIDPVVL